MSDAPASLDERILQEVPSMCDLLGLGRIAPQKLTWKDRINLGRSSSYPVPLDYVFVDGRTLFLAKRMQGVLAPDEWKPLIGSTLLVRSWARPRAFKTLLAGVIAALVYYVPLVIVVLETPIRGTIGVFLTNPLLAVIVGVIGFLLSGRIYAPAAHQEMLRADLQVAGLVGREAFITVLQKIDNMGFKEVQKLDRKGSKYKQPSVQERIQNLRSQGTSVKNQEQSS